MLGVLIYAYNPSGGSVGHTYGGTPLLDASATVLPVATEGTPRLNELGGIRQHSTPTADPTMPSMRTVQPESIGGGLPTPTHRAATPYPSNPAAWICQPQYEWSCETALRIAWCESRYDPTNYNWSGATGLFQIMLPLWSDLMHGGDPYDPWVNTQAAYELWLMQGWWPWTCY